MADLQNNPRPLQFLDLDFFRIFAILRPLGEKATAEYNNSYTTVFNLSDIYTPQTSTRHP